MANNTTKGGTIRKDTLPNNNNRYKHHQELDGIQHAPSEMKTVNIKQDYTIFIRKKKYYSISQQSDELYTSVYQVNNFISLNTNLSVGGRPGSCTFVLKGGEKVILADKNKAAKAGSNNFESLKNNWNDQIVAPDQMLKQFSKYYWHYAEKAEWEPMDEVYVYSKSRIAKGFGQSEDKYKFVQIFFGYITRVDKTYNPTSGLTISVEVEDHLKLLTLSRMSNRPPLDMAVGGVGVRFDGVGNMIVEDKPQELANTYQNVFSGMYPHEIVRSCALGAGIPQKYLNKRIEPVIRIPFLPQVNPNGPGELYRGEFSTRLQFCVNAAEKLNLEFFADETGNIVLKIPSYAVGINRMDDNFEGDKLGDAWKELMTPKYKTVKEAIKQKKTVTNSKQIVHVVKKGDTLWDLAKHYLGKATRWREIWNLNAKTLRSGDPHWIYPGERVVIKKGSSTTKEVIVGYKEKKIKIDPFEVLRAGQGTLSKNDQLIRVIKPEELLGFTLSDSDMEIYTAAQVTAEVPFLDAAGGMPPVGVTRAVQDFDLIRQFGFRMAPVANGGSTPIVSDAKGAEIYAGLIILKSLSSRFSGTLSMVEEPTIRVGDPIRFFSYDEHPFAKIADVKDKAQSVYYVEAISRQIQPGQLSTMSLVLRAGRSYQMPSIYDQCTELYRYYFEEVATDPAKINIDKESAATVTVKTVVTSSKTYTAQKNDSLWKLAEKFYGDGRKWTIIWEANRRDKKKGPLSSPNRLLPGQVIKIPPK